MQDLNDLRYFAAVVEHGGFSQAARALGVPKSRLSRRIAALEERLGVRLLQRSTRHFSVTDIGWQYQRHCAAMLADADAAQRAIELARARPGGTLHLSCPAGLLHARISPMLGKFMHACPTVRLRVDVTSRHVDVIGEGLDLALRARFPPIKDSDLVARTLGYDAQCLVGSKLLLARHRAPIDPTGLARLPTVDYAPPYQPLWQFKGPAGRLVRVRHEPRLVTDDITLLTEAVKAGAGFGVLPRLIAQPELDAGTLVPLLPAWRPRSTIIQAVLPTRRGMPAMVRRLLDFLAAEFERDPLLAQPAGRHTPVLAVHGRRPRAPARGIAGAG